MGAYKVGKIAQNRVPFLSHHLAEESWVKDRQWALDNGIRGFAGYPLVAGDRVVGVLASFSRSPFAPEFLEVLQVLCMTLTVALDAALQATSTPSPIAMDGPCQRPLSDRMAQILGATQLTLVGTERPLRPALGHVLLQMAQVLHGLDCSYCRLTYGAHRVMVEAIAIAPYRVESTSTLPADRFPSPCDSLAGVESQFNDLCHLVTCLGGKFQTQPVMQGQACQISIQIPTNREPVAVRVQCRHPLLRQGLTQLIYQAGLTMAASTNSAAVLITDDPAQIDSAPVLWIRHDRSPVPDQAMGIVDITTTPEYLREAIEQVIQGKSETTVDTGSLLSEREQQVMRLLAAGKRDRNIAADLYISESTVKFHINNSLAKLNARNRYQGVYQAAIRGWI